MSKTFIELCLDGEALIDEIDDYVDEWHEGDSDRELHEYLGLSELEYSLFVEKGDAFLKQILNSRYMGHEIKDVVSQGQIQTLAARAASSEESTSIINWLKKTGRM
ncbi:hypothetical protein ACQCT6_15570 [Cytobacillus gottheilii]|uniref:hypothetical protein n=1 Tax=Cytobacillus gottheilii TaxID=859144 RepID=UPI003CEABF1B